MGHRGRVERLREELAGLDDLVCAVSGGVDSAVLLHAAHHVLGSRAVGWIGDSPSLPRHELADAREVAAKVGARLVVVPTNELEDPDYVENAGTRCYFCRRVLFEAMREWARAEGFWNIAYGEITDDLLDVRPGRRAAAELRCVAPLAKAGFTKEDVRRYAREHGLPVADKPAAACLSSRIPVGTVVTAERLARIERSEVGVRALGFRVVRVRDHGKLARVELGVDEVERGEGLRERLEEVLGEEGFEEVVVGVYGSARARAEWSGGGVE